MRILGVVFVSAAMLLVIPGAVAADTPATADGDTWSVETDAGADGCNNVVPEVLADEIDQNQPSGPVYMAAFSQTDLAQSFMQDNANISGAGILLEEGIGSSDNVNIAVWDDLPNQGGTMLAEANTTGTQGEWVDVFWEAVAVDPGTTYFLVFDGNSTLGISGDTNNPYPDGCVYANPGYTQFPDYDYAFRTYYDTEYALDRSTWAGIKACSF